MKDNPKMVPASIPALGRFEGYIRFWDCKDPRITPDLVSPQRATGLIEDFMDNFPEVRKATEQIRKEKI
jgi:hypothetical protein